MIDTPSAPPSVAGARLASLLAALALAALVVGSCRAAEQWLAVTNTSDQVAIEFRVGGDRLRILAPRTTEHLPVWPAAWSWARRVEVYRYPYGERLLFFRADYSDLADHHWRLRVP